jgi:hypothetical protein
MAGGSIYSGKWMQQQDSLIVYLTMRLDEVTHKTAKIEDTFYFHIYSRDCVAGILGSSIYHKIYEYYPSGHLKKGQYGWWIDKRSYTSTTYYEGGVVMETIYHNKKHTAGKKGITSKASLHQAANGKETREQEK